MRHLLLLALIVCVGCATPEAIQRSLQHELADLQQLEAELLPLIPDGAPVAFGSAQYHPRDGWRLQLRAMQLRAAGLVAWANGETFDVTAGYQALVAPALQAARERAAEADPGE